MDLDRLAGLNAIEQFRIAIRKGGIQPLEIIESDGKLHCFATNGKRDDTAGWYVVYGDGVPAGAFGDWRTGFPEEWCADFGCGIEFISRYPHHQACSKCWGYTRLGNVVNKFNREMQP